MRARLGKVEKAVLGTLASRQMPVSFLKSLLITAKNQNLSYLQKNFYHTLSSLKKKGLLEIHLGHVNLTPKGSSLLKYLHPFDSQRHYATILVSPETAAQETGYSLSSLNRKKIPLYYIIFKHRLYILKRELVSQLCKKYELFPLLRPYELPKIIPGLGLGGLTLIKMHAEKTKEGLYHWSTILDIVMLTGKRYFPKQDE